MGVCIRYLIVHWSLESGVWTVYLVPTCSVPHGPPESFRIRNESHDFELSVRTVPSVSEMAWHDVRYDGMVKRAFSM